MNKKLGTKEHYFHTVFHMMRTMDKILERSPESMDDLKELFIGLQTVSYTHLTLPTKA